jgi:hypothetical protein
MSFQNKTKFFRSRKARRLQMSVELSSKKRQKAFFTGGKVDLHKTARNGKYVHKYKMI